MKKVSVVPNALMLNSLRDVGYTETDAISDIIDNSLDAGAKNVKITIKGKKVVDKIIIEDDGVGMNITTLKQALTLGSNVTRTVGSLGHYGLGLKTAAISIGKEFSVLTRKSKSKSCLGIFDIQSMISTNSYDIELDHKFKKSIGTIVTINQIDKLTSGSTKSYIKALKSGLGLTFTNKLKSVNITINGIKLLPIEIAPSTSKNFSLDDKGKQKKYKIHFKENGKDYNIKIKLWAMPSKKGVTPDIDYSQKNQGFYIFRNNRLIATGQDLGIYDKSTQMNRFRGEIYFDNMDEVKSSIGLNFSKRGINFKEDLVKEFNWRLGQTLKEIKEYLREEEAKDTIDDLKFENLWARKFTKWLGNGINWTNGIFNGTAGAVLTGAIFNPPKPKKVKTVVTKGKQVVKQKVAAIVSTNKSAKKKPPVPNTSDKNSKNNLPTGATTNLIIQKKSLGKDSIFWRFDDIHDGASNALQVTLNVDHIFYQEHYMKRSEVAKKAMLEGFLTVGRGMIESGLVTEDTEEKMNTMFDKIGDDCRLIT